MGQLHEIASEVTEHGFRVEKWEIACVKLGLT